MNFNLNQLKIKPLTPEYYDQNLELLNSGISENHFLARMNPVTKEESMGFVDHFSQFSNTIYLIATLKDKLVGHIFALPRIEELLSHIVNIGYLVHVDYRKIGVCSKLMDALIEEARRKRNIRIMIAEVAEDNEASINVLKKFGFTEFGKVRRGFMKKNEEFIDLLYFSKHLEK
ncbi:MAG: GNAT family N-acetyltransferase [Promethearchaeota archaeon]|nr:MAG: GNAT family N-acetyltransferase [Candidatus Lokiarchaeota archaeon]